jgi:hypothetical protein
MIRGSKPCWQLPSNDSCRVSESNSVASLEAGKNRARPSRDAIPSQNVLQRFAIGYDQRAGEQQARALELELAGLIGADPIWVGRTPNVMYRFIILVKDNAMAIWHRRSA